MSQTKLSRQRPTSAVPGLGQHSQHSPDFRQGVGQHSPDFRQGVDFRQVGNWQSSSKTSLHHNLRDPLEQYDAGYSVGEEGQLLASSSPLGSSTKLDLGSDHHKAARPRSGVRRQLRTAAQAAEQEAFISWRELMAEMLGDVTQDIIENMGKEFVNAIRIMRRDFDRAVSRVSEDVKTAQAPVAQAVSQSTSSLIQEIERMNADIHETVQFNRVDMDFSEIAEAIRENRSGLERIVQAVQERSPAAGPVDINLDPVLQAIAKNKASVDLSPVLNIVQETCTRADLHDLAEKLSPQQETHVDLSPVLAALNEKNWDVDLSGLVAAIQEIAAGVHAMRVSSDQEAAKQQLLGAASSEIVQTIQRACADIRGVVQESRTEVISAVHQIRPQGCLKHTTQQQVHFAAA